MLQAIVHGQLCAYLDGFPDRANAHDRLYILEFQGPGQYIKYGRTGDLLGRTLVHVASANRHGYVLFGAWASPPVADAGEMESKILDFVGWRHGVQHQNECFYELPFEEAVNLARVAFANMSGCSVAQDIFPPGSSCGAISLSLLGGRGKVASRQIETELGGMMEVLLGISDTDIRVGTWQALTQKLGGDVVDDAIESHAIG